MQKIIPIFFLIIAILPGCTAAPQLDYEQSLESFREYKEQLKTFRAEFREAEQENIHFFLFGMGNRQKLLYKNGKIVHALTGNIIKQWNIVKETIIPNEYTVLLETEAGKAIAIFEDERAVWVQSDKTTMINDTDVQIHLPEFKGQKYSEILKVLHHEILINIVKSKPLPNYFVYKKPWRRDAAMMAMCLEETGNIDLIKDWVLSIEDPYDHNNGQSQNNPANEPDNLGQTLYLLSLFSDASHPMVDKIMKEVKRFEIKNEHGYYIQGRSDFQEVPVFQTKWLKYGLESLGMEDPYIIPDILCNYSSLYWWGYKDKHLKLKEWRSDRFPYIGWARDHFYGTKTSPISNRDYPLTWETGASQADYLGMEVINPIYVKLRTSTPHTWHAAEIFLYLLDETQQKSKTN